MNLSKSNFVKLSLISLFSGILLIACDPDDEGVIPPATPTYNVSIEMGQIAGGSTLMMNTSNLPYMNAMGQQFNVTKLQYLISDVTFNKSDGSSFTINGYHYVDLNNATTLNYNPGVRVPEGNYSSISFTFGFDEEDNITAAYPDLNTLGWNWPSNSSSMFGNLGGGYHFLRLEGNYITNMNDTAQFKTHMGTARDTSSTPHIFTANHFTVTLPNSAVNVNADFDFSIDMNIEEWYTNPTNWDFNTWNLPIMPTFAAQRVLNQNGPSVFTVSNL